MPKMAQIDPFGTPEMSPLRENVTLGGTRGRGVNDTEWAKCHAKSVY